jgi:Predicted ferric reductase
MKYENWRIFHRLLIIPYALGVYHTYFSSRYNLFEFSPLSIWVGLTSLMGLSAGLYMLFFYQKAQFRYKGKITDIKRVSASSIEIAIKLETTLVYQSGQYVFLKIFQKGIEKAPHPFSISGGDGSTIYLTIKGLGDYTKQLYSELKEGTAISLDGPYGHLDFEKGRGKQLWIAGGIGITPFISYLKNIQPIKPSPCSIPFGEKKKLSIKTFWRNIKKTIHVFQFILSTLPNQTVYILMDLNWKPVRMSIYADRRK